MRYFRRAWPRFGADTLLTPFAPQNARVEQFVLRLILPIRPVGRHEVVASLGSSPETPFLFGVADQAHECARTLSDYGATVITPNNPSQ